MQEPKATHEKMANEVIFVVIAGLAIDVDNLLAAIDGKDFDPTLTPAELSTAKTLEDSGFVERVSEGMLRRIVNLKASKKKRISELLESSSVKIGHGVSDIQLPRREQVLMAISKGRLRYNSLTEFLGQFAELTEKEAGLVAATVEEVRGDLAEAQAASYVSAQPVSATIIQDDISRMETVLEMHNLAQLPIFLLERAILEIQPHEDDFQYFEEIRGDRGARVWFVAESALADAAFAVPLFTFAAGIASISTGWLPKEMIEVILSPTGVSILGTSSFIKLAQTFSKWTPFTDWRRSHAHTQAVRRSGESLRTRYTELAGKVASLKQTAKGKLNLLLLRETILASRDGGEHDKNMDQLNSWLKILDEDTDQAELFEDFAGTHSLDSMSEAKAVWSEFLASQAASKSLPEVHVADTSQNATYKNQAVKAQRLKQ